MKTIMPACKPEKKSLPLNGHGNVNVRILHMTENHCLLTCGSRRACQLRPLFCLLVEPQVRLLIGFIVSCKSFCCDAYH